MNLLQNQTLGQKLIMNNEMKQSLAILQMPIVELLETIKKELDENPVLEEDYSDSDCDMIEEIIEPDFDRNEMFFDDEKQSPLEYASKKITLKDFLYEQLCCLKETKSTKAIMAYMIENIDKRGYLDCSAEEIAGEMNIPSGVVISCLEVLQTFQPDGVFARDLEECLMLQLRKRGVSDGPIYIIVQSFLTLLSENKIKTIAQKLNISLSKAAEYCNIIKSLEPKPSRGFAEEEDNPYIIPEAFILKSGSGFTVSINEESIPKLKVSREYLQMCGNASRKEAKQYIKDRLSAALFLIRCVEQRRSTLCNILEAIVDTQQDYLNGGGQYLKPMTINSISSEIGCHESTVSRAIRDKYIQTPLGLMTIKSLFTSKCGESGREVSSNVIKNRIRTLIGSENKEAPLSDQQIADFLTKAGMEISRRTVAKYREEMKVPSSQRRREYREGE